ncbi:hypothetical protein VNI00_013172 [Paramarasmius palmivorus]|uniref:Uncharacterized protein n=1 Tax=Paramarasmius palmivorus TaxID=297713 RepID=A0AAW0BZ88_9AGAR
MAVSPITNTTSAAATVIALIEYLTGPLSKAQYSVATVSILRSTLFSHLAYLFATGTLAPFTFILSPHTLPPAPILAACMSSGINWVDWMNLITDGKGNLLVFVMQGCIRVKDGQNEAKSVWTDDGEALDGGKVVGISKMSLAKEDKDAQSPMANKLNELLASVRARRLSSGEQKPIQVPTLPQLTSTDDVDVDIDSDSESTTSSNDSSVQFAFSDAESTSSVSSAASSPAPIKVDLPSDEEEKPYVPPPAKYRPPFRAQSQRPKVEQPKANVTRYMYQGGQTGVITGGVMLGAGASTPKKTWQPKNAKQDSPHRPAMRKRSAANDRVLLGPDADSDANWRRRRSTRA